MSAFISQCTFETMILHQFERSNNVRYMPYVKIQFRALDAFGVGDSWPSKWGQAAQANVKREGVSVELILCELRTGVSKN